jgi:hypothetical protein
VVSEPDGAATDRYSLTFAIRLPENPRPTSSHLRLSARLTPVSE